MAPVGGVLLSEGERIDLWLGELLGELDREEREGK